MNSFTDILELQKEKYPERNAYTFLLDGEENEQSITYGQLLEKVKLLATKLSEKVEKKDRVLLCYPPGLEYIIAFYACLYGGFLAVPVFPPNSRNIQRVIGIIKNSKAKFALYSEEILKNINPENASSDFRLTGKGMQWLSTDVLNETETIASFQTSAEPSDIAFLQYTSGSTSEPKGVMVSHANLLANCHLIQEAGRHNEGCVKISWLPPYHDMGLIGCILQPLYSGMTSIIMSPASFLKKPVRWLKAISKYSKLGTVTSGGPNFSYDICCNYISENQMEGLDLSGWRIAYSGAEPVRTTTLTRFHEKFKGVGFRYSSFLPLYGLAEATLIASCGKLSEKPVIGNFNASLLKNDIATKSHFNGVQTTRLVGCGKTLGSQKIAIVNPQTNTLIENNRVGEIWMKGASIAKGYWENEKATFETFNQIIKNTNEGQFMRTGDLGFIDDESNALFITGRIKDLIIIHGQNYYPQDIEEEAQAACAFLKPGAGAAFSIDIEYEEVLVLVYELNRKYAREVDPDSVFSEIRDAIFTKFGLSVFDIVLIEPSTFPKTTSGKLQRQLAKKMYLAKQLKPNHLLVNA